MAPRQSGVFAINSSTGPARVMSAPHSFVYRVSAVPAAHAADVIASRRAAIDARVASDELLACARDEHARRIQLAPTKGLLLGHATGKPRPRLDDTWFTRSHRSARAHPILEFARKLALCRGPGSNWGHMVLQVMFREGCEFAPEPKHDDTWFGPTTNGSTKRTASRLFRPRLCDRDSGPLETPEASAEIEPR